MAATQASIGYGTFLKAGDGGSPSEVFTDFGVEITKIDPPGYSRDAVEATHMQSPGQFREFIPGLMAAKDISLEFNFVPSATDAVITQLLDGVRNWQIGNADWDVVFQVAGFFTDYTPQTPMEGKMTATATLKVTGQPTLTAV